jgi:hypothetical protein
LVMYDWVNLDGKKRMSERMSGRALIEIGRIEELRGRNRLDVDDQ